MNRIYQGRVSRAELVDEKTRLAVSPENWPWESVLWEHHALFQDAVNYYVVCLLALAGRGNTVFPIREKLDAPATDASEDELMVWRPFRRRGVMRRGLRDSVAKYLTPGNATPTPEECFAAVLAGNECALSEEGRKRLSAGLTQLLDKCTGDSGCRNSSKEFLPRFASPDYRGSYGEDTTTLARKNEAERFPFVLHAETTHADSNALDAFGVHSIALPNEKKPMFRGPEASKKLRGMVAEWRERQPENETAWNRLEVAIGRLAPDFELPGYAPTSAKNEVKFRLFAMFLFRYVERSEFTLGLLRTSTRKPAADEQPPATIAVGAGTGDPIRAARGTRGYVFRAFTSLPCWGGDAAGEPTWVQFDFSAFCEALKALHQVDAKADERAQSRELKQAQHDYQRGKTKKWKGSGAGEDESRPPVLAGDPRIARLEALLKSDLREEYEMSEGVSVEYGLHPRTIRGFREIRKKWHDALAEGEPFSTAARERLLGKLRDYQAENANTVGSVRIFEALLDEANWLVWREPTAAQLDAWRTAARLPDEAEFAKDPLQALTDERELIEEIERLKGPIRFTPADPEHSRRQFYFSDVTALEKKNRLSHDRQTLETEIAVESGGKWRRAWARIAFTAPRLLRDQLNNVGGADAVWQQAMMAALGLKTGLLKDGKQAKFADCTAVALMPEIGANGEKRILLNFPLTLDGESIAAQVGKAARWHSLQFGGADKESYWLRWPGTWIDVKKARATAPPAPWWKGGEPFRVLSVDLGQRDAGAFALLEVSVGTAPKPQSRRLGTAEGKTWWATVRANGMLRLPGEDALVIREGEWHEEFSGSRGRLATDAEWNEARDICAQLGLVAYDILGFTRDRHSFPETNDRLLFALRRAQSRLARLQSWSAIAHKETKPARRLRIAEEISDAEDDPLGLKSFVAAQQWERITDTLCVVIAQERETLKAQLVRIADRIQPLRGRRWEWVQRPTDPQNHFLRQTGPGTDDRKKLLAGQRGLSLKRVEQLESLRQRCQSLNRALRQIPGAPAKLGRSKRGIELPDPCPELLDRIEALKEQRVNQTAHLILAQALGVRLKPHGTAKVERAARDIHGEYERIPGREPVDFLVLENLDRYLATQGRSRSENSRLMKWCHRAILKKLKQLCEPYGLRVLETPAAYSSKFCSLTGVAGFRAVEVNPDDREDFRWKKHLERLADPERAAKLGLKEQAESEAVRRLFAELNKLNADLLANRPARPKWRTLLAPQQLGPIFVPMRGNPMQADINAAINLGLRAIAAPEADHIHIRFRAARDGETFVVRAENAREKARWKEGAPEIFIAEDAEREKLLAEARVNFFADIGSVAAFDKATLQGSNFAVASGRGLWGTIRQCDWQRCEEINRARVEKLESAGDEIPM